MAIPIAGPKMRDLLSAYREAWRAAGHPGRGRVMFAFHMYCAETKAEAVQIAREPLNNYLKALVAAAADWAEGLRSDDYPNYGKMVEGLSKETFESQVEKGSAWVGTPDAIVRQIRDYHATVGGFEVASMQVNFNLIALEDAVRSIRLFSREVMPAVQRL
jgi:alkanesulfonate monooxygenase SsuD/methylene tetrahydromethanopterin reductase-like flavin-dependent oxidoreductase (luciferase family)